MAVTGVMLTMVLSDVDAGGSTKVMLLLTSVVRNVMLGDSHDALC